MFPGILQYWGIETFIFEIALEFFVRRRTFLRSVGIGLASLPTVSASSQDCSPKAPQTPEMGDKWTMTDEPICVSENYNLHRRTFSNEDLRESVKTATDSRIDRPVQSLTAIQLSPKGDLPQKSEQTKECSGTFGITIYGFGLSLPCSWVEKGVGISPDPNPVSEYATESLKASFQDKINGLHSFANQRDSERHLQPVSSQTWQPLAYSKSGYTTVQFTYEPEWQNKEDDALWNDLQFRAYLSVETDGSSFLAVGGVFPDESTQRISSNGDLVGKVEFGQKNMQKETIEFMKRTLIRS
ncbi:hypothetical protein [Halarchaeum sp. P4]|uniref:hypothetical protein n=1 Tax=Halarchaeum sp. P4 TaxID=3421639 RepID=UPI003EC0A3BD